MQDDPERHRRAHDASAHAAVFYHPANTVATPQFDRTLKTNLYGYYMVEAAVPHMGEGSVIVMTGSVTGLLGNHSLPDYSMIKGGIHAFVGSLATIYCRGAFTSRSSEQ